MAEDKPKRDILLVNKKIKKEIARLKKLFQSVSKETMDIVDSLIKSAAFMTITLYDLQETINKEGAVSTYQNGENQHGTKKSPEVEIYNTMIKNHSNIIKQLSDLIPKAQSLAGDDLEEFIGSK